MKLKLLLLALLSLSIAIAKPKDKATINPTIGIMMSAVNLGSSIFFTISIKNTGEEILTNVYVTENDPAQGILFSFSPIASLAPGEEVTNLQGYKFGGLYCFDQSQVVVHATPSSSPTTEITDLSSDPMGYDINNLPGSYYNDFPTFSNYTNFIFGTQEGIYEDANHNSIIDVGDVINYLYTFSSNTPTDGQIMDNNATIAQPNFFNTSIYTTTGIHYITQAEVTLGYVYNSSNIIGFGACDYGLLNDASPCSCPNPDNANIVTALTIDLPNSISGKVKFNSNNDNCATGSDFPNRRVTTTDGNFSYSTYTNGTGNYHILIPNSGSYSTSALTNLSANFSSTPSSINVTSSGSGIIYNNTDFCIASATNYTDLAVNMFNINQAIPGNVATYRINYTNNGSTSLNGSIQLTYNSGKLTLASANPTQNSTTAFTITWNYSNLLPFETRHIDLSLNVLTPPTVNISDTLLFTVAANPVAGDNVPANNTLTWTQLVRSSFDPNDKTVIEGATINPSQTGNYLHYVTRFQNTGNADASTVVIKETLDPKLDWNTFEPIASSHVSNIQIKNGNEVTYTFSNINLPYESANEPASHGWMAYQIKPKADVVVGDVMASKSDIYFDYNPPIITNTASTLVTTLATNDAVKSNFSVYPNPAANYIVIETKTDIESTYEIIDINGKVLLNGITQSMQPVNISALQNGFYFLNLKTNQGKASYKLIKN